MADDLTKPLLGPSKRRQKGLPLAGILLTGLAVALVGFALWVIIWSAPTLDVDAQDPDNAADTGRGEVIIRAAEAEAPGVVITTPEGLVVDGNGAVIRDPAARATISLSPTPESALLETGPYGLLPRISDDGRRPFDAYARPSVAIGGQPVRIAIIVGGIGINQAGTEIALERLPGEVSLALAPYGDNLAVWAARGREAGHELLLQIPLEPLDFPFTDPGPHTLLVDDPVADNIDRLNWLMAQFATYAGVVPYAGSRFLGDEDAMAPIIDAIAARGLLFVDEGSTALSRSGDAAAGVLPFAKADLVLDQDLDPVAIAARLAQLETIARQRGLAIASASAFPVTIEQIMLWAAGAADRGIVLVPVSALANDPVTDAVRIQLD